MGTTVSREALLAGLERERAAMLELLPRFGDEQLRTATRADGWTAHDIAMHTADSNYGLALMVLGEIPPALQVNEQTGWISPDELNEQRRQKNATLPRSELNRCSSDVRSRDLRRRDMPRGDKSSYTDKQKRKAEHIEEGY